MTKWSRALATGVALAGMGAANAQAAEKVSIPFADLGNIRTWHAESAEVLYVQNAKKDWFKITFRAPCLMLPFATGISFVTDGTRSLDRYSSVFVGGENCPFRTFEQSAGPRPAALPEAEPEQ